MVKLLRHVALAVIILLMAGCTSTLPKAELPTASKILDSSGSLITYIGEYNREAVELSEISPYMQQAIVAIEDARFYNHFGIDPVGLVRAAYKNLRTGEIVEGGSTITQQLAKNLYLTHERTVTRKIKEMYYAVQLERHYTKEEIINQYLNVVYFGQGAYGIQVAAETFFNKDAKDLTLAESAWLAGLLKAPSFYSDPDNYEQTRQRQLAVLNRMTELNYITVAEQQVARKENITIAPAKEQKIKKAGYFVAEVIKQLDKVLPGGKEALYTGGFEIETSLDLAAQRAAEKALNRKLEGQSDDLQGALVAINPANGYVVAMVGGRDYSKTQLNRAVETKRQPGSAFKPFVYAAALEKGMTAASTFFSGPIEIRTSSGVYQPRNYNQQYAYRPMTLKEAIKKSDNVVAVQVINQIKPGTVVNLAQRMGIKSKLEAYPSLALGSSEVSPLEMASAYGAFAYGGVVQQPIYYTKVKDRNGKVLIEQRSKAARALSEQHAYVVTDMLKSVLEPGGTAGFLASNLAGRPAAAKTGTTDGMRDAWFVGYTPNIVAVVYVGYDQFTPEKNQAVGTGGVMAGPIWAEFISGALRGVPQRDFTIPNDIIFKDVCEDDGLLASPGSRGVIKAAFVAGTEPVISCNGNFTWDQLDKVQSSEPNPLWNNLTEKIFKLFKN